MKELSILLVEDNEDDRFLTMRVLKKLPFAVTVKTARNGDEALGLIQGATESDPNGLPSLVILDLQMPKIGGLRLLERIRELFGQEELPVIILSSSDNPVDMTTCRELGITAYLPKPVNLQQLQEALALAPLSRPSTPR